MTRDDWLASEDPAAMLRHLTHERHEAPGEAVGDHAREKPFASSRQLLLWIEAMVAENPRRDEFYDGTSASEADARYLAPLWCRREQDNPGDPPMAARAALLREIIGNPFHHLRVRDDWVTPTVRAIAQDVWETSQWHLLGVLADALEEAGCPAEHKTQCPSCDGMMGYNEVGPNTFWQTCRRCDGLGYVLTPDAILSHLRGPGPHVRGCFALDLVLGLS